jgi:Zn-finger nucleic acid-binding protein
MESTHSGSEDPMDALRCDLGLEPLVYEGVQIDACGTCRGQWLELGELKQITRAGAVRLSNEERRAIEAAIPAEPLPADATDRNLSCPRCRGSMKPLNYGSEGGLIGDRYDSCGVWLDSGELERAQALADRWQAEWSEVLRGHGPRQRLTAGGVDRPSSVAFSRFGFVNALINHALRAFD